MAVLIAIAVATPRGGVRAEGTGEPPRASDTTDAAVELDAKKAPKRTLRELPADRRLVALLAGRPDSRGGVIAAEELTGHVIVLVVSGRKSQQQARDWGAALAERLTGEGAPLLLPVADLSTVPERLEETVRKRLARDPRRLVLDWDGYVRRAHSLEGDGPWLVAGAADAKARSAHALPPLTPEAVSAIIATAVAGR